MKKHRRIQALLSLILAFACLSGCGTQVEQPSAAHEQLQSEAALEKTYRNMKENLMWS